MKHFRQIYMTVESITVMTV